MADLPLITGVERSAAMAAVYREPVDRTGSGEHERFLLSYGRLAERDPLSVQRLLQLLEVGPKEVRREFWVLFVGHSLRIGIIRLRL